MEGTFNGHALAEKLTKLNNSQQSIETLSHWCIFHRKKARQVVETWDRQFHSSPQEQRVSFLYLANDILQNSRRKGFEFVGEFWKVLPDALSDVSKNGDEFGRNTVSRLVSIWDERKVFGSRGQILKEEVLGNNTEHKNGKPTTYKLRNPCGDILEKLTSSYEHVYDGPVDEDALFGRCQAAISNVEKVGRLSGSGAVEELQGQHVILKECIEQLVTVESSRAALVSLLSEAIREQETKIEQIHVLLQAAQSRYEQVGGIYQQLLSSNAGQLPPEQRPKETPLQFSEAQGGSGGGEQATPNRYIPQATFPDNSPRTTEEDHRKTAAAAMAAKLAASPSSAQMLSIVLNTLVSEGGISQSAKEDYSPERKRPKLDQPPPLPPYPHPDSLTQPPPPLPPTMPPMSPPPPPSTQFMQSSGSMAGVPYAYGLAPPPPRLLPRLPGYPTLGMARYSGPFNPYNNFQVTESGLFNYPPVPATPPSSNRQ